MEIKRNLIGTKTISQFADENNLTMEITEHEPINGEPRFTAQFSRCEVRQFSCLASVYGEGYSEDVAIKNYCSKLSFKYLIIDAYSNSRREIKAPKLVHDKLQN
jgi:hypothetical protein